MPIFQVTDPKTGRTVELESQDNTPPTEQELEQVFASAGSSSQQENPEGSKFLSDTPLPEQKSPVSIPQRAWLSFHNKSDQEKILKKDFGIVQPMPDGNFMVGNDARDLKPISPDGLFNDLLGKIADHAADIPVIAGQLIALGLAPEVAIPARIALSAAGAGAGQAVSSAIGQKPADELATDVMASAAFGAVAEGIVIGAVTGKNILAPKLTNMLQRRNAVSSAKEAVAPQDTKFANTMAVTYKYLANVPEDATKTFFKYGMNEMNNKIWFKPESVKAIVSETVEALEKTSKQLGQEVARQTDELINPARIKIAKQTGVETRIPTQDLFATLKTHAQQLGILDDFGKVNKNYPNTADIKPVTNLLNELGTFKNGRYIADPNKSLTAKKALQISRAFGEKYEGMHPNVQVAFYDVLNGSEQAGIKGLRPAISEMASKMGVEGYTESLKRYSSFTKLLDDLSALNPKEPVKIEAFLNRLERVGEIQKDNLVALDRMTGKGLLRKWELWNAAQDFSKVKFDALRFGTIAGLVGTATGFDTKQSQIGTIVGAGLLGSPAGIRTLIRVYNRAGGTITKEKLQELGKATAGKIDRNAASAVLGRLIADKNKKPNKNKEDDFETTPGGNRFKRLK